MTRDEQQHRALPRAAASPHGAQCGGDQEQGVLENAKGERKSRKRRGDPLGRQGGRELVQRHGDPQPTLGDP